MSCTQYRGYSVRQGCKPHVRSLNATAAIDLVKICRVTQNCTPFSV